MRVIDTSAWIEYLVGSYIGRNIAPQMPSREDTLVPTIVQMELYKWLMRERSPQIAELTVAETNQSVVVPLNTLLAVRAAEISRQYRLSTPDAIIYATAQAHDADILTCDAHFEGLAGVLYLSRIR
jgi:predicted nucleic acid-binding protein